MYLLGLLVGCLFFFSFERDAEFTRLKEGSGTPSPTCVEIAVRAAKKHEYCVRGIVAFLEARTIGRLDVPKQIYPSERRRREEEK